MFSFTEYLKSFFYPNPNPMSTTTTATTSGSALTSSPAALTLEGATQTSLNQLRRINSLLLPVNYPDKFYQQVLDDPVSHVLTRLAFWEDECVGGIRCRLEEPEEEGEPRRIYVMTLAVLSPYRRMAVGTHLMNYILETAARHPLVNAQEAYAHVWVANEDALGFYRSLGFDTENGEVVDSYYRRLKPNQARIVTKQL